MIDPHADINWSAVWKAQMLRSREACPEPQARAETEEQRGILREYLKRTLREEPGGKGGLVQPGSFMRVKMWWQKQ